MASFIELREELLSNYEKKKKKKFKETDEYREKKSGANHESTSPSFQELRAELLKGYERETGKTFKESRISQSSNRLQVANKGRNDWRKQKYLENDRALHPMKYFFEDALDGMRGIVDDEVKRKKDEIKKYQETHPYNPYDPRQAFGEVLNAPQKKIKVDKYDPYNPAQAFYEIRNRNSNPETLKSKREEIERQLALLEAQKAERDTVIQTYPNYTGGSYGYSDYVEKAKKAREERLKPYEGLDEKVSALEKERDELKYTQYQMLSRRPDFAEKSQLRIGESSNYTKAQNFLNYEAGKQGISDPQKAKAEAVKLLGTTKFGDFTYGDYDAMTDSEVGTYHYLLNTEGEKSAERYLLFMVPTLRYRQGQVRANLANDRGFFGAAGMAVESGLNQFGSGLIGVKNAVTGNDSKAANMPGRTQYASGIYREGLNRFQKLPYDLATTTVNMAPSIAVSAVNPVAGSALLGTSAGGNAYSQSIQEGKEWGDALLYGALVGASESLMTHALGGVTNAGKGVVGKYEDGAEGGSGV